MGSLDSTLDKIARFNDKEIVFMKLNVINLHFTSPYEKTITRVIFSVFILNMMVRFVFSSSFKLALGKWLLLTLFQYRIWKPNFSQDK